MTARTAEKTTNEVLCAELERLTTEIREATAALEEAFTAWAADRNRKAASPE